MRTTRKAPSLPQLKKGPFSATLSLPAGIIPDSAPPANPSTSEADMTPGESAPSEQLSDTQAPFRNDDFSPDARHISPRDMAEMSMDLYADSLLSWEEYAMLAFQPELHPRYNATIGALVGEDARPNDARDFIDQWEKRLEFERLHNQDYPHLIERTQRIVEALRQYESER